MIEVAAGIAVREDGAVLLGQRKAEAMHGGQWEFPGGKIERGENPGRGVEKGMERRARDGACRDKNVEIRRLCLRRPGSAALFALLPGDCACKRQGARRPSMAAVVCRSRRRICWGPT